MLSTSRRATTMVALAILLITTPALAQSYPPPAGAPQPATQPTTQPAARPAAQPAYRQPAYPQTSAPRRRPMRRRRQRWHGLVSLGLSHFTALGDRSFALKNQLADKLEFEDSTGIDLLLASTTPGEMFDLGLRLAVGFGPLNRTAWQLELGNQLKSSTLLIIGPTALWHPLPGRRVDPYVGIDMALTTMGTANSVSEEVCDDSGCNNVDVDVPHVAYKGWSFGYTAGVRLFPSTRRRPWWVSFEAKYIRSNWTSLQTGDGFTTTHRAEDVSTMNLNQLAVTVSLGVTL